MRRLSAFMRNNRGVAAAEMAMLLPFLIVLMFGSMELGNYFYTEHKVVKAVRDGARFAARLPFDAYSCAALTDTAKLDQVYNLVQYGKLDVTSGDAPLVSDWQDKQNMTVSVSCNDSYDTGIYDGKAGGAPVVTVSVVDLDYPWLFQSMGYFDKDSFFHGVKLNASATAVVTGA